MNKAPSNTTAQYGKTNPSPEQLSALSVKRYGSVIGLNSEKEEYYRKLHANVWPAIIARLKKSNIQNYSIYISEIEGKKYLFSYFEYSGQDFDSDMRSVANDSETQRWWRETDPCQFQLPSRKAGANWSDMEMVFLME